MALVCKLEKYMMQLVHIMHKVIEQTDVYQKKSQKMGKITLKCDYLLNIRMFCVFCQRKYVTLYQEQKKSIIDKDINHIKVVLAEKGGAASLPSVSWRATKEPINGWQSSWDVRLQLYQGGVPMIACQRWKHISNLQNCLMWN